MEINRNAYQKLLEWRSSIHRKPLLLRGARQVGKTTLIRQFAKEFDNYIELTLEKEADRQLFEKTDEISQLLSAIYLFKQVTVNNNPTLLFIDEIQESPKAIQLLRYFYEEKPDLYVIAAGSLFEFALRIVPSFPVGRIEYLTLHPVNFEEFLGVVNPNARDVLYQIPIPEYAHRILLNLFHEYAITGGMPEVVNHYAEDKNIAALSVIYKRLWQSYKDDIEKYASNNTKRKVIRHVIDTAPKEADRIKFEGFGRSAYRSREVGEALRALDLARIIQLVYPTTNLEPPILANLKKRPRLQFLDTGLLNQNLLLQGDMIGIDDLNSFYKGKIIQHLVCQELISIHDESGFRPHFWVREEKNSNAEVDLVFQYNQYVVPIEICSIEKAKTPNGKPYLLMNLPYYLGTQIHTHFVPIANITSFL